MVVDILQRQVIAQDLNSSISPVGDIHVAIGVCLNRMWGAELAGFRTLRAKRT